MIWQLHIFSSGMLKKVKARLLTRAVQNSGYVFARAYRTATVREPVPNGLFQQPAKTFVLALALFSVAAGATVSGRIELISSHDQNVRKHTDYSGGGVWLGAATGTPVIPPG